MNVFTHLYVVFELSASSSKILLSSLFFLTPLSLSEAMMMTDTPQDVSQRLGDGECRVTKSDVVSCRAEVHGRTDGATHVPARDLTMRQQQQLVVVSFSGSSRLRKSPYFSKHFSSFARYALSVPYFILLIENDQSSASIGLLYR